MDDSSDGETPSRASSASKTTRKRRKRGKGARGKAKTTKKKKKQKKRRPEAETGRDEAPASRNTQKRMKVTNTQKRMKVTKAAGRKATKSRKKKPNKLTNSEREEKESTTK